MADDPNPLADAPDPTADTPDDEAEDTAQDDDSGQTDWTPKDRAEATRKISEQGRENAELRARLEALEAPDEDSDEEFDEDDQSDGSDLAFESFTRDSWEFAKATYGEDAITAYEKVYPQFERFFPEFVGTPADLITLLETYRDLRNGPPEGTGDQPAAQGQTRQQAVQPRVDTNRSDRGPDSNDQLVEARKSGKLGDFASAAAEALGFGSSKR